MLAFEKSPHCFSLLPCFMSLPEPEALISCSEGVWVTAKPDGDQLSNQRAQASARDLLHGLFPAVNVALWTRGPEVGGGELSWL